MRDNPPLTDATGETPAGRPGADLRERLEHLRAGHPSSPRRTDSPDRKERKAWRAAVPGLHEAWARHQEKWPRQADSAGQRETRLSPDTDQRLAAGCDQISRAEERITASMHAIEADGDSRGLAGLAHRRKGKDRIREKAGEYLRELPGTTPEQALALMPDAVRYTFRYGEDGYARGVVDDIGRLLDTGFEPVKMRNYWENPEYKGVNSQWRDPATGQRFEVQFHTAASLEAKELTHGAYERLRTGQIDDTEELALEHFQRSVAALVPVPPGATDIPEYR